MVPDLSLDEPHPHRSRYRDPVVTVLDVIDIAGFMDNDRCPAIRLEKDEHRDPTIAQVALSGTELAVEIICAANCADDLLRGDALKACIAFVLQGRNGWVRDIFQSIVSSQKGCQ
jgi:hypothetical protein